MDTAERPTTRQTDQGTVNRQWYRADITASLRQRNAYFQPARSLSRLTRVVLTSAIFEIELHLWYTEWKQLSDPRRKPDIGSTTDSGFELPFRESLAAMWGTPSPLAASVASRCIVLHPRCCTSSSNLQATLSDLCLVEPQAAPFELVTPLDLRLHDVLSTSTDDTEIVDGHKSGTEL